MPRDELPQGVKIILVQGAKEEKRIISLYKLPTCGTQLTTALNHFGLPTSQLV